MGNNFYGRSFGYLPFYPRGGTNIPSGLRECIRGMEGQGIDKAVTIVITDMWDANGDYIFNAAMSDAGRGDGKSCDEVLRAYGPTFYIAIADYNSKQQGEQGMAKLSARLNEVHGKNINPPPGLFEAIDHTNSSSAISLGGGMAKMAQMTK